MCSRPLLRYPRRRRIQPLNHLNQALKSSGTAPPSHQDGAQNGWDQYHPAEVVEDMAGIGERDLIADKDEEDARLGIDFLDFTLWLGWTLMATAEALMELVPNGHSKRTMAHTNGSGLEYEDENSKERAMAATYAAYTKRTKLHAEKAKAQQVALPTAEDSTAICSTQGGLWLEDQTRQSLNEVENLYFHLSRARPVPQPPTRTEKQEVKAAGPSTPPMLATTPVQEPSEASTAPSTESTQEELPLSTSLHTTSLPGPSTSPVSLPFRTASLPQPVSAPVPKRHGLVERTRTGGIVRSQPPERLRTGGKVKPPSGVLSPKKRGRPRLPDELESTAPVSSTPISGTSADGTVTEGTLTYDSFWSSLNSLKTPTGS
ncbi:hypothetical protein AG1IA_03134 [Rhizoctonia solani AG-1 IA]|uniref:Uncharacterized protein n=1 Tax=Thanatephorus cucumeris (strain AG1-IA) TaxID=983506 RepID=L8X2K6_THACA|nr:hypothetical protein AG1IA_03134 [Rhizoctonia solani AG-1 IA]